MEDSLKASKEFENDGTFVLSPSVFFSRVGDKMYVRDVDSRMDFLLSDSSELMLQKLKVPTSVAALINTVAQFYNIDNTSSLREDILSFLQDLMDKGLVHCAYQKPKVDHCENTISSFVKNKAVQDRRLWSITLELTYRCNEKCIHCYLDDSNETVQTHELSGTEWKKVIDQCYDLGCLNVLVTGGEPTLHSDFLEICKYVVSKGMLLDIYTNGLLITDEIFEGLIALKLNSISVSLYGLSSFHDSVTKIRGSFDKTLQSALKFKCAGKDVFIKASVFRNHLSDFFALKKLGDQLGIIVAPSVTMLPSHTGESKRLYELTDAELVELTNSDAQSGCASDSFGRAVSGPVCMAGQNQLSFSPFGDVYACNAVRVRVGVLHNESIEKVWKSSKRLGEIRSLKLNDVGHKCRDCTAIKQCAICLGTILTEDASGKFCIGDAMPICQRNHMRAQAMSLHNTALPQEG